MEIPQSLPAWFQKPKTKKLISFNRILVLPDTEKETVRHDLIIPEEDSKVCESGTVVSVCQNSYIKVGDKVMYQKLNRDNKNEEQYQYDFVEVEEACYDSVFENEIFSVNEEPFNRIFVETLSDLETSEHGIIYSANTLGFPQKGIVYKAPINSDLKAGDKIEYRKEESKIYHQVDLNGAIYDVLFEGDIFTVNGHAANHKIIVEIDLVKQELKQNKLNSGLIISPLFQFMLHNLQLATIVSIGKSAQKIYPDLKIGDTAIIKHTVESQDYRRIKLIPSKKQARWISELRIINCFDENEREIFGKFVKHKIFGNNEKEAVGIGDNIFCKWKICLFEKEKTDILGLTATETSLNTCQDIEDLRTLSNKRMQYALERSKRQEDALMAAAGQLDQRIESHWEKFAELESDANALKRNIAKIKSYLQKDHLVLITNSKTKEVLIAPYKHLYPIYLENKKYIISNTRFILAKMENNKVVPFGDKILVKPIEIESVSGLIRPDIAKEKPMKGEVVSVGNGVTKNGIIPILVKEGDTIYYAKHMGTPITIDDVDYLVMNQNDALAYSQNK